MSLCHFEPEKKNSSWTDKFRMSTAVAHLFGIGFKLLSLGHRSQQNEVKSEPAYLWGLESIFVWLWREINVLLWEIDTKNCISCRCLWANRKEKAWKYADNPYLQETLWSLIQYFSWYKMFLYIINNKHLDAQSRNNFSVSDHFLLCINCQLVVVYFSLENVGFLKSIYLIEKSAEKYLVETWSVCVYDFIFI